MYMGDTNPELILISAMIQTSDALTPSEAGITSEFFKSYSAEFEWITNFRLKHSKAPDKATFRHAFPDFTLLVCTDMAYAIEQVAEAHVRHTVTKTIRSATEFLRGGDFWEAAALLQNTKFGHTAAAKDFNPIKDWSETFSAAAERANRAQHGISGVPLGYPTLDERTGGAQPGDLWLFAARLGQGKTWNLVNSGTQAIMQGKKISVFSLEQPAVQMAFRFQTTLGRQVGHRISNRSLNSGKGLDLVAYQRACEAINQSCPGELLINDTRRGKVTPLTIAAKIEQEKPDVVYVDYITLLGSSAGGASLDDWRVAAKISGELKQVAMEFNIPIIAAAQINREGDGNRRPPRVRNLSQADSLGQDSDGIVTMCRPSKNTAMYSLEKFRNGEDGIGWYSSFAPDAGEFSEITYDQAQSLIADSDEEDY